MLKHVIFLRWWLFFILIALGTVFTQYINGFEYIWEKDSSKLSFLILTIFYITTIWCGIKTWNLSKAIHNPNNCCGLLDSEQHKKFKRLEDIGWFNSELCLTLGMLGTIVGFIMMLGEFEHIDVANVKSVQGLLTQLGQSMATALWTTAVGLTCGMLLKIQYFNLGYELQKHEK
jgi:hypothetical protein